MIILRQKEYSRREALKALTKELGEEEARWQLFGKGGFIKMNRNAIARDLKANRDNFPEYAKKQAEKAKKDFVIRWHRQGDILSEEAAKKAINL